MTVGLRVLFSGTREDCKAYCQDLVSSGAYDSNTRIKLHSDHIRDVETAEAGSQLRTQIETFLDQHPGSPIIYGGSTHPGPFGLLVTRQEFDSMSDHHLGRFQAARCYEAGTSPWYLDASKGSHRVVDGAYVGLCYEF